MFMGHDEQEAAMAKAPRKKAPTSLDDAIKVQRAVVDQLADEHAEAHEAMAAKGEQLMQAHAALDRLLTQKAAE